jgi:hypothetical protein
MLSGTRTVLLAGELRIKGPATMERVNCRANVQGKCAGCGGKHVAKDDRGGFGFDHTVPGYLGIARSVEER